MKEILSVSGLTIQVHGKALMRDVSFSVGEGEAILLSGANGVGKSTLLKALLRLETEGKQIDGHVTSNRFGDVLALSPEELQRYRASVAYVSQKDEYAQIGNMRVRDLFSDSALAFSGRALSDAEVNDLIDEWIPRRRDNSRVFSARSVPAHFSGGEQRLLSVLSTLATRPNAELLIVDEPLNNLDFDNVRNISNVINRVIRKNPHMGLLIVSHCRILPFITREIELTPEGIQSAPGQYISYSCFGKPDENGYFV